MLRGEDLSVIRGERLVFRGLRFAIPAGGALVLAGANGSGKSTLLRLMAGLIRPDAGSLFWNDADVSADAVPHGARVAFVGHQDAVKPGLTAAENLAFAAGASGLPVPRALESQGLETLADLPARLLSAGQKRRLALCRLVLSRAALWLLDEPTVGLDQAAIARLGDVLAQHRAAGGMIAAATHVALPLPDAAELRL